MAQDIRTCENCQTEYCYNCSDASNSKYYCCKECEEEANKPYDD